MRSLLKVPRTLRAAADSDEVRDQHPLATFRRIEASERLLPPCYVFVRGKTLGDDRCSCSPRRWSIASHEPDQSRIGQRVTLDDQAGFGQQVGETKAHGQIISPCLLKREVPGPKVLKVWVFSCDAQQGDLHVDEIDASPWCGKRCQMTNYFCLAPTIVGKDVAAHDHVEAVEIERRVGCCTNLNECLGIVGHFLKGHVDDHWIGIDADRVSMRPNPLGDNPEHGTRTAADVRDARSLDDTCRRPIGGLV